MMASVELDYKSCFRACEVRDEVSYRELSPETKLLESFCTQSTPQFLFRVRLLAAEPARAVVWKCNSSDVSRHRGIVTAWRCVALNLSRRLLRFAKQAPTSPRTSRGEDPAADKQRVQIREQALEVCHDLGQGEGMRENAASKSARFVAVSGSSEVAAVGYVVCAYFCA